MLARPPEFYCERANVPADAGPCETQCAACARAVATAALDQRPAPWQAEAASP